MSSASDDDRSPAASGRVTVTDIAAVAGVSVMTVSRALSGKGYVANIGAKAMKGGRTGVLGLLVSDFQSPVVAAIIGATSRIVKQAGLDLILYDITPVAGKTRPDIGTMFSTLCDGLLLVLPGQHAEQLDQFLHLSLPVVLVNYWRGPTPLPVVRADNYEGAYGMTEHLLGLGHRRIAFVRGTVYSGQSAERERGYLAALAAAGVAPDPTLIVDGEFSQRSGFEQGQVLLDRADRPTAVFCANDLMAQGLMDAARARGLEVPAQLSIAGFDDIPAAAQCHPALTTVRQDYEQLGENAVRLLLQHIEHGSQRGMRIELQSHLVVRDSTAPPQASQHTPAPRATAARKRS